MSKKGELITQLRLKGLRPATPQQHGAIRLIPLLRDDVRGDLRLSRRRYADLAAVTLDGELHGPGLRYIAFVPHGLVMSWSEKGEPVTAFGTQLCEDPPDGQRLGRGPTTVRLLHRMVRREADHRLRFLPLHLAMEGFLSLHFGGPEIAWSEYSKQAIRYGLDPRIESAAPGRSVSGLEDALRLFEIHERQCGVLVLVADALASAFVVPHPQDYRLLHDSLLEDFFGALIREYSWQYRRVPELDFALPEPQRKVTSVGELQSMLGAARAAWRDSSALFVDGLLGRAVRSERIYQAGPFSLQRFCTSLSLHDENHIGEAIVRDDGTLEYLKTYRLSSLQTKRAYLLELLARHHFNLDAAAASQSQTRHQLVQRLDGAGFAYLLADEVLRAARKHAR
ncbi:MAG: hypothetical protein U1A78_35305 [Polyangia bacterium]